MENVQTVIAKDLLKIKAVFFRPWEPFTWASGIKSPGGPQRCGERPG